jgi:predicted lipid carrier protein YhbT
MTMSTPAMTGSAAPRVSALVGQLPTWLRPLHWRVARTVARLPSLPPSWLAAQGLTRWLWPRLPQDARSALQGRVVALEVTDLGWRVRLRGLAQGFAAAGDAAEADLRIAAEADGWWRLARGDDDPDRLFFDRVLVMEGDTELGLVLKNSLDAMGPLWPARPAGR